MKKNDFNDGVCNTCGNTGLAGDTCIVCGDKMSKIDEGIIDPVTQGDDDEGYSSKEPEVYPLEVLDEEVKDDELE